MKKVLLSILVTVYMVISSGIAMEIHYCMGKRSGVDFYTSAATTCGKCGMEEQNKAGCCHDDHQFFKLSNDHKNTTATSFPFAPVGIILLPSNVLLPVAKLPSLSFAPAYITPFYDGPPIRIMQGVFRV